MQKLELEKLNLLKLQKEGFSGIDMFSYPCWDTSPEEEHHAFDFYGADEPVLQTLSPRQIVAPNPNSIIFEHLRIEHKVYPPGVVIWNNREAASTSTPFSTPMDLQQLMGLLCTLNVGLPQDHSQSDVTFQTEDILLANPEASSNFSNQDLSYHGPKLIMKLSTYKKEI